MGNFSIIAVVLFGLAWSCKNRPSEVKSEGTMALSCEELPPLPLPRLAMTASLARCEAIDSIETFVDCLNGLKVANERANLSDALQLLSRYGPTLSCTTSDQSAQPGSPQNPRCFLQIKTASGAEVIPSWTLEGNGDRFEVGETVPTVRLGPSLIVRDVDGIEGGKVIQRDQLVDSASVGIAAGDQGMIMADIEFAKSSLIDVRKAYQHAYCGNDHMDPCSHCHSPIVATGIAAAPYGLGGLEFGPAQGMRLPALEPGNPAATLTAAYMKDHLAAKPQHGLAKPVLRVLRPIDPERLLGPNAAKLVIANPRTFLEKLHEPCLTSAPSERCKRLAVMLSWLALP